MEDPSDINKRLISNIITAKENPNPIIISCIVVVLVIFVYYINIHFIKPNFSGKWLKNGEYVVVSHNKWTDEVSVKFFDKDNEKMKKTVYGSVSGKAITLFDDGKVVLGTMHLNKIYWIGNKDEWEKPY